MAITAHIRFIRTYTGHIENRCKIELDRLILFKWLMIEWVDVSLQTSIQSTANELT